MGQGSGGHVRLLVARLASSAAADRRTAERAILEMGPDTIAPLLEILVQGKLAEVEPIRELLPKYGPEAIGYLYRAGRRDYGGTGSRVMWEAAAEAVGRMGEPAVPVVMEAFDDPSSIMSGFADRVWKGFTRIRDEFAAQ